MSDKAVKEVTIEVDEIYDKISKAIELEENNELSEEYKEDMKIKMKKFKDNWYEKQDKLSMFFEHDELEKVTRSLVVLEENSKNEEYETSLENIISF